MENFFLDVLEFLFFHFYNHQQHQDLEFSYPTHLNNQYNHHHLVYFKKKTEIL
jgi:hypothetical protein